MQIISYFHALECENESDCAGLGDFVACVTCKCMVGTGNPSMGKYVF